MSPLNLGRSEGPAYVSDTQRVLRHIEIGDDSPVKDEESFEKAGPRERIYFAPSRARAAILTAGGLCPGINSVIRSVVLELAHRYQVSPTLGFRFGFSGLDPAATDEGPVTLGLQEVRHIHGGGGTILGTSRGGHSVGVMVETLRRNRIDMLFAIGGDGTMRGAHAIAEETTRQGYPLAVVGIPKTIDNDVPFVDATFGFETAVAMVRTAIDAAHNEAISTRGGVGLVKTMGREAGFIAAHAALASLDVNVCLVPEVGFRLDGPNGLLAHVERRIRERGHAVIVVAEGCGATLRTHEDLPHDASGNASFGSAEVDIGPYLKNALERHLVREGVTHSIKYIDPSYMIRGVAASAIDASFCAHLGRMAVHAAMAGKTDLLVGHLHRSFVHVPLPIVLSTKKRVDPSGELWLAVVESTGQPRLS
jgi:6-phosphofructokinase 1